MKTLYKTGESARTASTGLQTKVLTEPEEMAISLAEAKDYLKIDHDDEDALLQGLIRAVTAKCENYCGRAFNEQTRRAYWSDFGTYAIIPYPPHNEIESVQKYNGSEWADVDDYSLTGLDHWTISISTTFSTSSLSYNQVRVDYECGYEAVPDEIIFAIKDTLTFLYENRGELREEGGASLEGFDLTAVTKSLLFKWRVYD